MYIIRIEVSCIFENSLLTRSFPQLNNMKQMQKVLDYVFTHVLPDQRHAPEGGLLVKWFPRSERATYHFCMGKFLLMQHNVPEVETCV